MFIKLDSSSRKLLKDILDNEDRLSEFFKERFEGLSAIEDNKLRSMVGYLEENNFIEVDWAENIPCYVFIMHNGRTYFEREEEYIAEQSAKQNPAHIFNIETVSNSIIGNQQNAVINVQCNTYQDLERLIDEKGGNDKEELLLIAQEIKDVLNAIQNSNLIPHKTGIMEKVNNHLSKHGWFYGAVIQLLGSAVLNKIG